jgi:hypothetical protein
MFMGSKSKALAVASWRRGQLAVKGRAGLHARRLRHDAAQTATRLAVPPSLAPLTEARVVWKTPPVARRSTWSPRWDSPQSSSARS